MDESNTKIEPLDELTQRIIRGRLTEIFLSFTGLIQYEISKIMDAVTMKIAEEIRAKSPMLPETDSAMENTKDPGELVKSHVERGREFI